MVFELIRHKIINIGKKISNKIFTLKVRAINIYNTLNEFYI